MTTEKEKYNHSEAFNLMRYASEDANTQELLWNSRDGVTPFGIKHPTGVDMLHVAWRNDVRVPRFWPPIGSRVFVDLSPERGRKLAEEWCEAYWEDGLKNHHLTKNEAIEAHIAGYHEGEPDIVIVDAAFLEALAVRYAGQGYIDTRAPWDIYQFNSMSLRFA